MTLSHRLPRISALKRIGRIITRTDAKPRDGTERGAPASLSSSLAGPLVAAPESTVAHAKLVSSPLPASESLRAQRDALLTTSRIVSVHHPMDEQAQLGLEQIITLLHADRAFLSVYRDPDSEASHTFQRSVNRDRIDEPDATVAALIERVRANGEVLTYDRAVSPPTVGSDTVGDIVIAAPCRWDDRLIGVLVVDGGSSLPGADDLDIAIAIARQVAIAIAAAQNLVEQEALREENARLIAQLHIKVDEITRSRQQITAAEERLRREIAELLHSRVQTRLLLVWNKLGICSGLIATNDEGARNLLNDVRDEVDQIREQEIREASHLLHPSIIRVGLVPAVRSLTNRFEDYFRVSLQIDPRLIVLDAPTRNRLDPTLRLTAHRVLEEAFSNIYHHARASLVEIALQISDDAELVIVVRDNGQGFDSSRIKLGLGLNSIAGRVDQFAGRWTITSAVDRGTTLTVRLPLEVDRESTSDERLIPEG